MLLDEPEAGLFATATVDLFEHLVQLVRHRGVTALVVEHEVDAVFRFYAQVTALDLGQVILTGSSEQVRSDARVVTAYPGSAG